MSTPTPEVNSSSQLAKESVSSRWESISPLRCLALAQLERVLCNELLRVDRAASGTDILPHCLVAISRLILLVTRNPPGSRTTEQFDADLRDLDRLPELRKRLAAETKVFCDPEQSLYKKAELLGFRHAEVMHPYLIKGKELPRDLEDWGKRMLAWVCLSARVSCLEQLKKSLSARARLWSNVGVVGKKVWASLFP